jgi:hypothetical protein
VISDFFVALCIDGQLIFGTVFATPGKCALMPSEPCSRIAKVLANAQVHMSEIKEIN